MRFICLKCLAGEHGEDCGGCACKCRAVLGLTDFYDPTAPSVLDQRHQPNDCDCGCMAPPPLGPVQGPALCRHGHLLTPDNVKQRHGRAHHWECRTCRRASEQRRRDWLREWANQPPKSQSAAYTSAGKRRVNV